MKLRSILLSASASAVLLLGPEARATIIGGAVTGGTALTVGGGTFVLESPPLSNPFGPPNSVGNNTFQNPNLYGFDEDQNVAVGPLALTVDVFPVAGSATIAAGTVVASHYVFFDPEQGQSQLGYVDFDADVLGILTRTATLAASDYLANTGVNYLNPAARGLEPGDSAVIDPILPYRVLVDWSASSPGDYIRVLTRFSPGGVPDGGSCLGLFGIGLAGLAWVRRKTA